MSLVIKDTMVGANEKESMQAYALSKMTVYNDITKREKYSRMEFTEMLEYLARIAEAIFKDVPRMKDKPLD